MNKKEINIDGFRHVLHEHQTVAPEEMIEKSDSFYQFSQFYTDLIKNEFKNDISQEFYNKYENGWYLCKGKVYTDPDFQKLRNLYNVL